MKIIFKYWPYYLSALAIIILAAVIRLVNLEPKPLHHDESIHAYFSWVLYKDGNYEYHPLSHGPLLYYLINAAYHLKGVSDAASRLFPAIFGTLLVILVMAMGTIYRRRTLLAVALIAATSPMLIYVSRFARHDMISLFLTLAIIISTISYLKKPKPIYIYTTVLAFFLSYTNHELTYLTALIWLVSTFAILFFVPRRSEIFRLFRERDVWHLMLALVMGCFIAVLFYSSFGHFPEGLKRALPNPYNPDSALGYWIDQQGVKRGSQPLYFYILILPLYEIIPFVLGLLGSLFGLFQKNFIWRYFSFWALLTLAIYSIAGEKMPWLTVHPLLPLVLVSGCVIDFLRNNLPKKLAPLLLGLFFIAIGFGLFNAYRLSFKNAANPVELAVYVQTQPVVKELTQEIKKDPKKPSVTLGYDLAWPMAWYLRDYQYNYSQSLGEQPTDIALFSLDENNVNQAATTYPNETQHPFRSWWVPDAGYPGANKLLRYYFLREPWNELGSYDFLEMRK